MHFHTRQSADTCISRCLLRAYALKMAITIEGTHTKVKTSRLHQKDKDRTFVSVQPEPDVTAFTSLIRSMITISRSRRQLEPDLVR